MYGRLWRHLPGPVAVRALLAVLLAVVVVTVLFGFVFPMVEPLLPFDDGAVDGRHRAG